LGVFVVVVVAVVVVSWRSLDSKERSWKRSLGISVKVKTESSCWETSLLP
jgi:hypothetical protein